MDIIKRFPEHELAIERLVRKNEGFRSMCEDYAVGVAALRRWERASDPEARGEDRRAARVARRAGRGGAGGAGAGGRRLVPVGAARSDRP